MGLLIDRNRPTDDPGDRSDRALMGTGIATVDDEVLDIAVGDRVIRIGGTMLDFQTPQANAVRDRLAEEPDDGTIRILLSHRPDTVFQLPVGSRVDLTVAGHTYGGQIVLPIV